MKRRSFLSNLAALGIIPIIGHNDYHSERYSESGVSMEKGKPSKYLSPLAIAMWDFSWLERRWSGAGYEDWDLALDELIVRGYNAVRIDAYPHLMHNGAEKDWTILPHWDNQDWGSPAIIKIRVQPNLNQFIQKCKDRGVKVALSTWWREDNEGMLKKITTPEYLAEIWSSTLESIRDAGLLESIFYVDLSNEYSIKPWTPYLPPNTSRNSDLAKKWAKDSTKILREKFPNIPFCFSITTEFENYENEDVSMQDLLELHIWIANCSEFNKVIGYDFPQFGGEGYAKIQKYAEKTYREKPEYWLKKLKDRIDLSVRWSEKSKLPIITTECWNIIDYKDYPMLNWDWVKEGCEYGVTESAKTGKWMAMATSNFCGPQFKGMWRDISWHQRLTNLIKSSDIDRNLQNSKLYKRLENT